MAAFIPALIGAAGTIGAAYLSRDKGTKRSKTDKARESLINDLLASLQGEGSFSDLFSPDEAAFQKSFVDPAKSMFANQIAPQIQQSFISSGMQRGTGLDDTLTRAGVDLDQLLNQQYMQFLEGAQNRKMDVIGKILGTSIGAPKAGQSAGQAIGLGLTGFLEKSGPDLYKTLQSYLNPAGPAPGGISRKGFSA